MDAPKTILSFESSFAAALLLAPMSLQKCGEIQTTSAVHRVNQIFPELPFFS
jgi:hypothetical protein